jgi:hypothetical protein
MRTSAFASRIAPELRRQSWTVTEPREAHSSTKDAQGLAPVDRYIEGFERVRLLAAKHPPEELPPLCKMAPSVVRQYQAIWDEHKLGRPMYLRGRPRRRG